MPRNQVIGGNKRRKGKKNSTYSINKNDLIKKDDDQMYARVVALLGNGRLNALCDDGETRLCKIRGKMMKKDFIKTDGIILVSRRDYEDKKADVIHKYNDSEVRKLMKKGQLPNIVINAPVEVTTEKSQEATLVVEEDITIRLQNIKETNTEISFK